MSREAIGGIKCYAGGQPYCLHIGSVLAIERGERMVPDRGDEGPCGWLVRRRSRLPVYGLAELLGTAPRRSAAGFIVIVNDERPWGLAVDRVARMEGGEPKVHPLPAAARGPHSAWFRGVLFDSGSLLLMLEPKYLLAEAAAPRQRPPRPSTVAAPRQARNGRAGGRLLLFPPPNTAPGGTGYPAEALNGMIFGLSYTQTLEIVSGLACTPVPSAPPHVLGLVFWRSRPLAVVDAGGLMGLGPVRPDSEGRYVVVRSPRWHELLALPASPGIQTRKLPFPHWPGPADLPLDLTCVRGVFALPDNRLLVIPDLDALAAH